MAMIYVRNSAKSFRDVEIYSQGFTIVIYSLIDIFRNYRQFCRKLTWTDACLKKGHAM